LTSNKSVGYDFLRAEYTEDKHREATFVQMEGIDEYLHHAADSETWTDGIVYDPENDGTPINSLETHEHWNYDDNLLCFLVEIRDDILVDGYDIANDDLFNGSNHETSRVGLRLDKVLGFSMAYCENDDPDEIPKERDNFFGSVEVPEAEFNSHWENANGFGTMKLVDEAGYVSVDEEMQVASNFKLEQNYPNPFNPTTTISYTISKDVNVILSVYNLMGQKVAVLVNEYTNAGYHKVTLDALNLASGVYYYKMRAGDFVDSKRCC